MRFEQAKEFILKKLTSGLPPYLCYHNVAHVIDVYQAAENIALMEHISKDNLQILLIASLFHDSGFMNSPDGHEEDSCRIANVLLPDFGYTPLHLEQINGLIMA